MGNARGAAVLAAATMLVAAAHGSHAKGGGLATLLSFGASPAGAGQAIHFAEQQIGCPYVWAGTGPCSAGFDCSGLTMEAYASAGVSIPRTSEAQWAGLPHVPPGQREPGDLVFFAGSDGTPASPGHVGIILGRHRMVEAYMQGVPVRIVTYGLPSSPPGDQVPVGFARPGGG